MWAVPRHPEGGRCNALTASLLLTCAVAGGTCIVQGQEIDEGAAIRALEEAAIDSIGKAGRSVVAIARIEKNLAPRAPYTAAIGGRSAVRNPSAPPRYFGSGVVYSSDGFIVTCAHVLGDPREFDYMVCLDRETYRAIDVRIPEMTSQQGDVSSTSESRRIETVPARVMASDAFSDLAVLKIDASGLRPIQFGEVGELRKGSFVISLGNPDAIARDGLPSASWGMISNLKRRAPALANDIAEGRVSTMHGYGTLLQVDTRVAVGTSGGALVDLEGRLVGVMTALVAREGAAQPAGLAIPADEAMRRVVERMKTGRLPEFGFLGVQPNDLTPNEKLLGHRGVLVRTVIEGLPGQRAGIDEQDVITQVNASKIAGRDDLLRELSRAGANEDVVLFVEKLGRPGDSRPVRVKLSKRPSQLSRLSYASAAPQPWRGITVDYTSTLPQELLLADGKLQGERAKAKIAVKRVEPGSDAWRVGIRPGDAILSVLEQPMASPERFYSFTQSMIGTVIVKLVKTDGTVDLVKITDE